MNERCVREANINVLGDMRMPKLLALNERAMEIREAVNDMKLGKASGLDRFPAEW